jgi:hypothetical protein
MKVYFGGDENVAVSTNEAEAIKAAFESGFQFTKNYQDGFIEWTTKIPNREKLQERYAFCFYEYIKDMAFDFSKNDVLLVEKKMLNKIEVEGKQMPIPLKGYADLVFRRHSDKKVIIKDHKFTGMYSDEDKIDGGKLVQ